MHPTIEQPDDAIFNQLLEKLREQNSLLIEPKAWVSTQLSECAQYGVFGWFIDVQFGGAGWTNEQLVRGYLGLSSACLSTTFVITQRTGACKRLASTENIALRDEYLPALVGGDIFATVGISHLTTSRRHLGKPVLRAEKRDGGFVLNGYCPWVTGANNSDVIVIGATLPDGEQVLLLVPTESNGLTTPQPQQLIALNASQTGQVHFEDTFVDERFLLAGPHSNVMSIGAGAGTGGLQTSTLAVGLARSASEYISGQAEQRPEFQESANAIESDLEVLKGDLLAAAIGDSSCSSEDIRTRANSLALRSSQAAMAAAKGAGFVEGHPAGRWCREALFFLVWSCPQPVMQANLCELAGIE